MTKIQVMWLSVQLAPDCLCLVSDPPVDFIQTAYQPSLIRLPTRALKLQGLKLRVLKLQGLKLRVLSL
jgi:hypothetical protein